MAQAGIPYPRTVYQFIYNGFVRPFMPSGNGYAPRKIKYTFPNVARGTAYEKWRGLVVMSELAELNGNVFQYRCVHPSDPDSYFRRYATPKNDFIGTIPANQLVFEMRNEFWDAGVRLGTATESNYNPGFPTPGTGFKDTGGWGNLVDPIKFFWPGPPNIQLEAVAWGEDPSYQPYRTRP